MSDPISIDVTRGKQLLHATVSLGQSGNPALQILVRQAIRATDVAQGEAEFKKTLADFRELAARVKNAQTLLDLEGVLISDESRRYEVDRVCEAELLANRLVPSISGFLEGHSVQPLWTSVLQDVSDDVSQRIKGARDEAHASAIYQAVGAVLGWKDAKPADKVIDDFIGNIVGAEDQLNKLWENGKLDAGDLKALTANLVASTGSNLSKEITDVAKAFQYAATLGEMADKFIFEVPKQSEIAPSLKAGASALAGMLGLVGAREEAAIVEKASNYLQSASQVQQCASLLMAGATGWGAAIAVYGIVSGAGGLGIFGGPGGEADEAQKAQAAVLQAIQGLQVTMLREFSKVNEKLAEITVLLNEILEEVRKANMMLGRVLSKLEEVDGKIDLVLLRLDRNFLRIIEELHKAEDIRCIAEASEREITKSRLSACIAFYSRLATDSSKTFVFSAYDGTFSDAVKRLDLVFSSAPQRQPLEGETLKDEERKDAWRSTGVLKRALSEMGLPLPGLATNAPILIAAMQNMAELYKEVPQLFKAIVGQDKVKEGVKAVRIAAIQHDRFIRSLRGDPIDPDMAAEMPISGLNGAPVISKIMRMIGADLDGFKKGCETLRETTLDKLMGKVASRTAPFADVLNGASIQNAIDTGWNFTMLDAPDVAASEGVRLLLTCIRPSSDADRLRIVLTSFNINERIKDQTYPRLVITFNVEVYLYNKMVTSFSSKPIVLLFDRLNWAQVEAAVQDGLKLMTIADNMQGPSGAEALGDQLVARLNGEDLPVIRAVQRERLKTSKVDLDRAFAEAILAPEQNWGNASSDLKKIFDAKDEYIVLRAVLRTAFEVGYNACDVLPAAFEGSPAYRLMDFDLLKLWAQTKISLIDYGKYDAANPLHKLADSEPEKEAKTRLDAFAKILESFIDSARNGGGVLGFDSAKEHFEKLARDYSVEGPQVRGMYRASRSDRKTKAPTQRTSGTPRRFMN